MPIKQLLIHPENKEVMRYIVFMLINVLCVCRLSAESFDYYYYGPRHYDGDFLRALDFCEIGFKNQMEVLENHKAQIVFEDDILAETQNFKIYNYGGDIDDGTLVMYFDGQLLPLGLPTLFVW